MEIFIELNQKFGKGYQVRMIHGALNSVIDAEPFKLAEAVSGAKFALDEVNKELKTNFQLHKVLRMTEEALKANRFRDFESLRFWHDAKRGNGVLLQSPKIPTTDYKYADVDGKEEILFTGRGTILLSYFSWKEDNMPKAELVMRRYCQLLAFRKYGAGATVIFDKLKTMSVSEGTEWIKETYEKYIHDGSEVIDLLSE